MLKGVLIPVHSLVYYFSLLPPVSINVIANLVPTFSTGGGLRNAQKKLDRNGPAGKIYPVEVNSRLGKGFKFI
jgi:hypothetical protein